MFNLFKRKQPAATASSSSASREEDTAPAGFSLTWTESEIRNDPVIKDKLRVLDRSGLALPKEIWGEFVVDTVVTFALWVQEMPASASYHHAHKKGLLYHSLDVAIYAQRLRRNYIMPPNTPPEEVLHREIIWSYGVFLAALFHDAGKILDFHVEIFSDDGNHTSWTPVQDPLGKQGKPYRLRYKTDRAYLTHQTLSMAFMLKMLGNAPMLAISSDNQLFGMLSKYFAGISDADNVIEQVVKQADAASVAQDLGASKAGIDEAAKRARLGSNSLAEQLHTTLTYLIGERKILLNKRGAEGFVSGEYLYLVCKPIAETIRTTLLDRGISNVPASNTKLFNILQQHNIIRPNSDGMAVWNCHIHLTDVEWQQQFTCLCIHLPTFAPEAGLSEMPGTVTVLENPEPELNTTTLIEPVSQVQRQVIAESVPLGRVDDSISVAIPSTNHKQEKADAEALLFATLPGFEMFGASPAATESPSLSEDEVSNIASTNKLDLEHSTEHEIGEAFWGWIEQGLVSKRLRLNEPSAFLHIVQGKLLIVSPTALKLFCETQTQQANIEDYALAQKAFQSLKRHSLTVSGRNIHRINVSQSQATLNGFLVSQSEVMKQQNWLNNPSLVVEEA